MKVFVIENYLFLLNVERATMEAKQETQQIVLKITLTYIY